VIPRVHVVDVHMKLGETLHVSPIFDAHIESADCDYAALKRMADERRGLNLHRCLWLGDFCDLVTPVDLRRFRPSVQHQQVALRDDWINAATELVIERIEGLDLKHDLFSPGNHEDSALQHSGYDITSVVASHFHAGRGGYSGVIDYKLRFDGTTRGLFRAVYHHGAWGGRLAKGYNGASPWFSGMDGWNVGLFGHNHASRVDPEVRRHVHNGKLEEYPVFIVNCGAWVRSYSDDAKTTHYAERKGYQMQPRACPLIRVTPRRVYRAKNKIQESRIVLETTVEV
jgi:hypothetical protein